MALANKFLHTFTENADNIITEVRMIPEKEMFFS